MENIPTVRKHVDNLAAQVPALQTLLDPIVHGVVPASLSPLEQAQHYALLAYALDSVIFAYLKSTGADTKEHPIMIELERIKVALGRIKRVEAGGEDKEESQRQPRIDKAAAERIIAHGTGRKPRHTVFDKDGKSVNPDEYLHKMAVESEKTREAKANPVEISDDNDNDDDGDDDNQKPEEEPVRKKSKSSKSKKSKK